VWSLRDGPAIQAMRVEVGRGSVTVINATPFRERSLFDGDHGWLFAAATGLRRGDAVIFLSEDAYPSLLTLLWRHAAPVVILTLTLIALVMWRDGVRFGPLAAVPEAARRSLVEQIRATGQFILRHGGGGPLHAAAVRALDEAAARRVSIYASLSPDERAAAWPVSPASTVTCLRRRFDPSARADSTTCATRSRCSRPRGGGH
jgi:hypothetical protein